MASTCRRLRHTALASDAAFSRLRFVTGWDLLALERGQVTCTKQDL